MSDDFEFLIQSETYINYIADPKNEMEKNFAAYVVNQAIKFGT